jgi:hypothetical protein
MDGQRYRFGPFLLDVDRTTLFRDGSPVTLGTRAFALLRVLLDAGNREVSKADLIDAAWPETAIEESNLSVQVANLRRLLGPNPQGGEWIATVARPASPAARAMRMAISPRLAISNLWKDIYVSVQAPKRNERVTGPPRIPCASPYPRQHDTATVQLLVAEHETFAGILCKWNFVPHHGIPTAA